MKKHMYTSAAKMVAIAITISFFPFSSTGAADGAQIRDDIRAEMTDRGRAASEEIIVKYKGENTFRVEKLPRGTIVSDGVRAFAGRSDVEYAEPNYIAEAYMLPNDPHFSLQWNLSKINMPSAWNISTGAGVTVAVIDTGVAYENYQQSSSKKFSLAPDLAQTAFVSGYDFHNNDAHPNDDNGHGTHVAGTIAGSTNNAEGVAGIAFAAKIMPVKVLGATGTGTYSAVANGIRFAADNGAKVINLSLGGPSSQTLADAVNYAHEKGVVIVAASGNESASSVGFPAGYDCCVIAVGATRYDNAKAPYSNTGSSLDIVAPGGDTGIDQNGDGYVDGILQQTFSGNSYGTFGYYFFQGTSMATPHVAGVAALLIAHGNATTPADVRTALESTALDLGAAGFDNIFGYGLLDPVGALAWGEAGDPPPPPPPGDEPPPPPAEIEIFADSFEVSEWNGLWTEDAQNDWFRSAQRATQGTRSAEVDGAANDATLTSVALDLQGKTNATITFSWFIESRLDSGEYIAFDISTDGGATWAEKGRLSGNVSPENSWQAASVVVNGITDLKLRFRGKMSGSDEDADVDNVRVVAW